MPEHQAYYQSAIGGIELAGTDAGLTSLRFVEGDRMPEESPVHPALQTWVEQLDQYFAGTRREFEGPLAPDGTPFQLNVWQALQKIPYGRTVSYLALARTLGNERAVRAVGRANGRNPIAVIIPCHRVIGRDGRLTGYGGGLWRKEWLLRHEGSLPRSRQISLF
jgi:methylated-DNA-[protein]-cysteine S-methyltransferase